MLEDHKKKGSLLNVQCKKKKPKRKKTNNNKKKRRRLTKEEREERAKRLAEYESRVAAQSDETKTSAWETHAQRVGALIQNGDELHVESDELMPFDFVATSDSEFDAHVDQVVEKIQRLIVVDAKVDDAVALFREARFLFARHRELFGYEGIEPDEEYNTFKSLIMKKLEIKKPEENDYKEVEQDNTDETNENEVGSKNDDKNEQDEAVDEEEKDELGGVNEEVDEEENDEAAAPEYVVEEENLDFERFLFRYTHPHVLKCYILMLGEYGKNSDFVNRCCMSMLERIAYDCKAPQCLYQLSLFVLINRIYKDPLARCMMSLIERDTTNKTHTSIEDMCNSNYSVEDMLGFFRSLMKNFFVQATKNAKLYLEVLFFKDKKIIFELGEESEGYQPAKSKAKKDKKEKPPKEPKVIKEKQKKTIDDENRVSGKKRKAKRAKTKEIVCDDNSNSNSSSKSNRNGKTDDEEIVSLHSDDDEVKSVASEKEVDSINSASSSSSSSEADSNSDDDVPLKDLIKSSKRQKLVLSDDE